MHLLMNLTAIAVVTLTAWFLAKHPKGKKLTINAQCERAYAILMYKILRCEDPLLYGSLEDEVQDFYNEFAGKALRANEYRKELYNLITRMQYV